MTTFRCRLHITFAPNFVIIVGAAAAAQVAQAQVARPELDDIRALLEAAAPVALNFLVAAVAVAAAPEQAAPEKVAPVATPVVSAQQQDIPWAPELG